MAPVEIYIYMGIKGLALQMKIYTLLLITLKYVLKIDIRVKLR